ncbi:uncharacterized protein N7482_005839 [Penicillium canariense]|uniref:chitinase n=1 Tax=Penicillium canariense TaxID=189055 RepID=A0A9W9I587_9EURO|nr:uncharacterized protein N7482_005839 [Penicillium canariense]KAJ5167058.1 hypothetical protein N7482_005839 [Penicillium canariense]
MHQSSLLWLSGFVLASLSDGQGLMPPMLTVRQTNPCPISCTQVGFKPSDWTWIHRTTDLVRCNSSLIFDMNVQNFLSSDIKSDNVMRVCTLDDRSTMTKFAEKPQDSAHDSKDPDHNLGKDKATVRLSIPQKAGSVGSEDVSAAANELSSFLKNEARCGYTIMFAKTGSAIVGIYAGSEIQKDSAARLMRTFSEHARGDGTRALQVCDSVHNGSKSFGAFATHIDDLPTVQSAVKGWTNANCLQETGGSEQSLDGIEVSFLVSLDVVATASGSSRNSSKVHARHVHHHKARGTCSYLQVRWGDSCPSLESICGISANDFTNYNPKPNLCTTLAVGQFVCCSSGTLPDPTPQQQANGSCYTYQVQIGEGCFAIAESHYITQDDIESYNGNAWGWAGCGQLQPDQSICLSKGAPPFPAPISNAVCGPQVPGTQAPSAGTNISMMNLCPLNACCDAWGMCGTTSEFCTPSLASTGAPGSHKPLTNGCISNCGTDIVNNDNPPVNPLFRIGYFEGYNFNRPCLNMDVTQINVNYWSSIHFAFGIISQSFEISIDDLSKDQFDKFLKLGTVQKILSFGGWDFSTNPATYMIFREGTKPANRQTFANNVYPGEPDIVGIPQGSKDEGDNYLEFLRLVRTGLGTSKSIFVALPASYWYLKQFPVDEMQHVVDYFIYMTYDLHGQWDFNNANADEGCPGGNCLRSDINMTATVNALSMLTKAGVSSTKITLGVTSYGRSFRMSDPSCWGPDCTYTGGYDVSNAREGVCTTTAGFLANAEIKEIIQGGSDQWPIFETYYDDVSRNNILIYGDSSGADWVSWMNSSTWSHRLLYAIKQNMGGSVDWAIDLEDYQPWLDGNTGPGDVIEADTDSRCAPAKRPSTMDDLVNSLDSIESICWNIYAMDILHDTLDSALDAYTTASEGYDDKFDYYVKWVKESISPSLKNYLAFDNGPGNKYFDCTWEVQGRTHPKAPCPGPNAYWNEVDETWTVTYELKDADGFYAAVETDLGISKDWIKFGESHELDSCAPDNSGLPGGKKPCRKIYFKRKNFPVQSDNVDVANPKNVIQSASTNITELQLTMLGGYALLAMRSYDPSGDSNDVLTASAMPVFMVQEAVKSMARIKDIGAQAKAQAKKDLILEILNIVLLVIPVVGEAAGALFGGAAMIARIATLIGEAGNAAMGIESIVQDPLSAPFVIMGYLVGTGGSSAKSESELWGSAAKARSAMKAADLRKFSADFQHSDSLVQAIVSKCVKK